jgi:CRP/FNR family transcriptional regulator, anaerobic regulatory protein
MSDLIQYIRVYFSDLNEDELIKLSSHFQLIKLKKNEYFLDSGQMPLQLGFVQSGLLRIYAQTLDKEVTQWISSQSYFVTDLSGFINAKPSRWKIQALSDCEIYVIQKSVYDQLSLHIPQWPRLEKVFLVKCFTTLEERVFGFISMSAEERYHAFFGSNKTLFHQVPLQYIASMLGMTPETFSRIRKKDLQ